uniref:hypothetical protein n=1 Tax=Methylobacterium sp. B34 TaxID=95563 RepID=UPI00034AE393|nr:hypothetical protein [Methylobacterium sp. B34]
MTQRVDTKDVTPTRRSAPSGAVALAGRLIPRREAIERPGLRDYADLLVLLGDHGLVPPRPSDREVEEQVEVFERLWHRPEA